MPTDSPALSGRLDSDMKDAMRAGDKVRLGAIRRARAALKNAEIEARAPLGDDAAVRVLRGLVKQHRESIEGFTAGGRDDLVAKERAEMEVLEAYLPAQMDAAAIEAVVSEVIASEGADAPSDTGRVMKAVMGRVGGQADGKEVRGIVQRLLGGQTRAPPHRPAPRAGSRPTTPPRAAPPRRSGPARSARTTP
jgi:uncharacterized protein